MKEPLLSVIVEIDAYKTTRAKLRWLGCMNLGGYTEVLRAFYISIVCNILHGFFATLHESLARSLSCET